MDIFSINRLKQLGFNPENILDIGAYHGKWTDNIRMIYPLSNYTLIEAIDYDELNRFENDSRVTIIKKVLSNEEKEVNWYQMKNTGDSLFRENTKCFENCEVIKKNTTTLDSIFSNGEIFEFIKLDVQGAELLVLDGGKELIKKAQFITLETPFVGEYNKNAPSFSEYISYMDNIGFVPFDILEYHKINNFILQIDIIFIRKGHELISTTLVDNLNSIMFSNFNREHVIKYVKEQKKNNPEFKVIDIGGSAEYTSWSYSIIDYIADVNNPPPSLANKNNIKFFKFNFNYESEWEEILEYVEKNGKFDFCICSHVIEDISTPYVLLNMINKIAKEGFIGVPSKYRELSTIESEWLGYIHHRWLYSIDNGKLIAYPKVNFIDKINFLTNIGNKDNDLLDLSFFWKGQIKFDIVNNDYLGPDLNSVIGYYKKLINDDSDIISNKLNTYIENNNLVYNYLFRKIFHVYELYNIENFNDGIKMLYVIIPLDNFNNNIEVIHKLGFTEFDIAHVSKFETHITSIDIIFIRKGHELIHNIQNIINNLGGK